MPNIDLATPLTLPCGAVLPNRLAKAAMTEGLADSFNRATPRHARLYRAWAEGGIGLSITGNVMVDRRYLERAGNLAIDGVQSEQQIATLKAYAAAGQIGGGHIWMQISHAGRQSQQAIAAEPVGPSAVGKVALPGGRFAAPRALSAAEIDEVVARFVHTAAIAQETGFDGVQIHAAHGYLLSEFLNPLTNRRTDQWGGDLANRARLLLAVIAAVRARLGAAYPIGVKLNSSDFQKGGFSFEDCLAVVALLETAGVDMIEISGGNYEQPQMMGLDGLEPVYQDAAMVKETTRQREAYFLNYAAAIRRTVSVPLMVTGGFRSRAAMLSALNEDGIALIGIARPFCLDPDLPKALLAGEIESLPTLERSMRLGPGWFGPQSSNLLLRTADGLANMACFYRNIIRMADGKPPHPRMNLLGALIRHEMTEAGDARRLER